MNLEDKYVTIRRNLTEIFESNHRCYGYRRLQALLARQSVTISEKVVQRLMKQERLVVARPRRLRFGSYLGEISSAPENLINRDFRAKTPNEKWLTEILVDIAVSVAESAYWHKPSQDLHGSPL